MELLLGEWAATIISILVPGSVIDRKIFWQLTSWSFWQLREECNNYIRHFSL